MIVEIEIPKQLYEMLLIEAAKTGSAAGVPLAVEEIAEHCFKKFMERNSDHVKQ